MTQKKKVASLLASRTYLQPSESPNVEGCVVELRLWDCGEGRLGYERLVRGQLQEMAPDWAPGLVEVNFMNEFVLQAWVDAIVFEERIGSKRILPAPSVQDLAAAQDDWPETFRNVTGIV